MQRFDPSGEQAFTRATGAAALGGNAVRLLRDATENYPAWLEAIAAAERFVHFESYIISGDATGRRFVAALAERARQGLGVRVLYDWLGTRRRPRGRLFRPLVDAGAEVRCFNPPRLDSPLGWLTRDHRKMVGVDGRLAFVSGLCVSGRWEGDPARGLEPWRDTGIEVRGPAVAEVEQAFARSWATAGGALPDEERPLSGTIRRAGEVALRVVAADPQTSGIYRVDQLVAGAARRTLWLTDAYFVGTALYVQALRAAARDGVDVRLLVPGSSDLPALKPITRAGYRALLEAGVRVYEWNGPMLHAKTATADGRWSRIGSTNLNLASWIGNHELDVVVEDAGVAQEMERMYEEDLGRSTEIVLRPRRRLRAVVTPAGVVVTRGKRGSVGRAVAGTLRVANAVGAAVGNQRVLGPAESRVLAGAGLLFLGLTVVAAVWPRLVAWPLAAAGGWLAIALLVKAWRLRSGS